MLTNKTAHKHTCDHVHFAFTKHTQAPFLISITKYEKRNDNGKTMRKKGFDAYKSRSLWQSTLGNDDDNILGSASF